ncbi:homeobox protein TGIF1-like [Vombatus ursinus]|uniref:homeobox protein TGIF1-like n=1 Tax=Vombatus ursinus TaxID=29139 RepID=UPI000FFD6CDA|nr:homeobox protein TGIF1-like [Vombatus ursinus]
MISGGWGPQSRPGPQLCRASACGGGCCCCCCCCGGGGGGSDSGPRPSLMLGGEKKGGGEERGTSPALSGLGEGAELPALGSQSSPTPSSCILPSHPPPHSLSPAPIPRAIVPQKPDALRNAQLPPGPLLFLQL